MKQFLIFKICAYSILTLCILGGALTYATSVLAQQRAMSTPTVSRHADDAPVRLAFVTLSDRQPASRPADTKTGVTNANQQKMDHFLAVIFWFLGSAIMAMVGYKRMRYSDQD